ncbi:MAG: GntR family transcriptional regulator [Lachnospiraceae bacterium]|nr:GntR family transcriptional regulator [Lachnospiraceae bacterium]
MKETGYKKIAYDHIKKQIVSGELLPGDVISEKELISVLGFSRTPIREAIQRLAEEGLLMVLPSRGTIVSHISVSDIGKIYEARKLIEPYIVRLAVDHVEKETLLEFRKLFEVQNGPFGAEQDWDSEFHLYLGKCSQNRFFQKTLQDLMTQSMRIRMLSSEKKAQRMQSSKEEHLAIIDALLEGDKDRAEKEVLNHLLQSEEGYKDIYPNQAYFSL